MNLKWFRIGVAALAGVVCLGIAAGDTPFILLQSDGDRPASRAELLLHPPFYEPKPLFQSEAHPANQGVETIPLLEQGSCEQEESPEEAAEVFEPLGTEGTLAVELNGKLLGKESYTITGNEGDSVRLTSLGNLAVETFLLALEFTFRQEIVLDPRLRPLSVLVELDGLLGMGSKRTEARVEGARAIIKSGSKRVEQEIEPNRTFVLAMFSSYALLPMLIQDRAEQGSASFMVLAWGDPADKGVGDGSQSAKSFPAQVALQGKATIVATGEKLQVEQYRVTTPTAEGLLLAREQEFIGFLGQGEQGPFSIYRSDYFPRGFQLLQASP